MPEALKELCRMVRESKGMVHIVRVELLRDYLRTVSAEVFASELGSITDTAQLRALQEAGVPKNLFKAYNKRLAELV